MKSFLIDENGKTDEGSLLKTVVKDYADATTFHGVKQIFEEESVCVRRVSWAFVVLAAIAGFSYAISIKLIHYYEYPSQIDLTVTYLDDIEFPEVYLCNPNPLRRSRIVKSGLYDIVTRSYVKSLEGTVPGSDDFVLLENVCELNLNLTGKTIITYSDIPLDVCQVMCLRDPSDECSGILYDYQYPKCTITSTTATTVVPDDQCKATRSQIFFRKKRKPDFTTTMCVVETYTPYRDHCHFSIDGTKSDQTVWQWTDGNDHTYEKTNEWLNDYEAKGSFFEMIKTDTQPGQQATIISKFALTSDKCLRFFFNFFNQSSDQIEVVVVNEDFEETIVETFANKDYNFGYQTWFPAFVHLPEGMNQIFIRGVRGNGMSQMAIDDIEVHYCDHFKGRECIEFPKGDEYLGKQNRNAKGKRCDPWHMNLRFPYERKIADDEMGPYCRYKLPEQQNFGCYNLYTGQVDPCALPHCSCRGQEFQCGSGECLPDRFLCDRVPDCADGSDELKPCGMKRKITCDFEDSYLCGYINTFRGRSKLEWTRTIDEPALNTNFKAKFLRIGCHKERRPYDLPFLPQSFRSLTDDYCAEHCERNGFRYAAVRKTHELGPDRIRTITCHCGLSFGIYGSVSNHLCEEWPDDVDQDLNYPPYPGAVGMAEYVEYNMVLEILNFKIKDGYYLKPVGENVLGYTASITSPYVKLSDRLLISFSISIKIEPEDDLPRFKWHVYDNGQLSTYTRQYSTNGFETESFCAGPGEVALSFETEWGRYSEPFFAVDDILVTDIPCALDPFRVDDYESAPFSSYILDKNFTEETFQIFRTENHPMHDETSIHIDPHILFTRCVSKDVCQDEEIQPERTLSEHYQFKWKPVYTDFIKWEEMDRFKLNEGVYYLYFVDSESACSLKYIQPSATITSPNYPELYGSNLDCVSMIRAPETSVVRIEFSNFDVEASDGCHYDWVEIHDVVHNISSKHCGRSIPEVLFIESSLLAIKFHTDGDEHGQGFRLRYEILSKHSADGFKAGFKGNKDIKPVGNSFLIFSLAKQMEQLTSENHCLTFDAIIHGHVALSIFVTDALLENSIQRKYILDTDENDFMLISSKINVDLGPHLFEELGPRARLAFQAKLLETDYDTKSGEVVLKNLKISSGSCLEMNEEEISTMECNFENEDICGMTSFSGQQSAWVRETFTQQYYEICHGTLGINVVIAVVHQCGDSGVNRHAGPFLDAVKDFIEYLHTMVDKLNLALVTTSPRGLLHACFPRLDELQSVYDFLESTTSYCLESDQEIFKVLEEILLMIAGPCKINLDTTQLLFYIINSEKEAWAFDLNQHFVKNPSEKIPQILVKDLQAKLESINPGTSAIIRTFPENFNVRAAEIHFMQIVNQLHLCTENSLVSLNGMRQGDGSIAVTPKLKIDVMSSFTVVFECGSRNRLKERQKVNVQILRISPHGYSMEELWRAEVSCDQMFQVTIDLPFDSYYIGIGHTSITKIAFRLHSVAIRPYQTSSKQDGLHPLGCFRALSFNPEHEIYNVDSPRECLKQCQNSEVEFDWIGMAQGNRCLCKKSHEKADSRSTECELQCEGDSSQLCGGYGSESHWAIIKELDSSSACTLPIDLALIIDVSQELRERNSSMTSFLEIVFNGWELGEGQMKVSIVYGAEQDRVGNIEYESLKFSRPQFNHNETYLNIENGANLLRLLKSEIFTLDNGDRSDALNVVCILTDNEEAWKSDEARDLADLLKKDGYQIIAAGIRNSNLKNILSFVTSKPGDVQFYPDIIALNAAKDRFIKSVCLEDVKALRPDLSHPFEIDWAKTQEEADLPTLGSTDRSENKTDSIFEDIFKNTSSLKLVKDSGFFKQSSILKCTWDKRDCLNEIVEVPTDLGNCLVFNYRSDDRKIAYLPGLEHGLHLELNVQEYDSLKLASQDSGVKVYLGGPKDAPLMGSLGFAVSPGTHTLVSLAYGMETYLEPPYGTCGHSHLDFYDEYSYSRCQMECLTKKLYDHCACREYFMPGDAPVCDLVTHLKCGRNVLGSDSADIDDCKCVGACNTTQYTPSISSFRLAYLTKEQMKSFTKVEGESLKESRGLELRVDLDNGIAEITNQLLKLFNKIDFMERIVYLPALFDPATSFPSNLGRAIKMLSSMANEDVNRVVKIKKAMLKAYQNLTMNQVALLKDALSASEKVIQTVIALYNQQLDRSPEKFQNTINKLSEILSQEVDKIMSFKSFESIDDLNERASKIFKVNFKDPYFDEEYCVGFGYCVDVAVQEEDTLLDLSYLLQPDYLVPQRDEREECEGHFVEAVKELICFSIGLQMLAGESLINDTSFNCGHDSRRLEETILSDTAFKDASNKVQRCLSGYEDYLYDDVSEDRLKSLSSMDLDMSPRTRESYAEFRRLRKAIDVELEALAVSNKNMVSRLKFISDAIEALMKSWKSVNDGFKEWLSTAKDKHVSNTIETIFQFYRSGLIQGLNMIEYFPKWSRNVTSDVQSFQLWMKPTFQLFSSDRIHYVYGPKKSRLLIPLSVKSFFKTRADKVIRENLGAYFQSLHNQTSLYVEYLENGTLEAITFTDRIQEVISDLSDQVNIDEDFVRSNIIGIDIFFKDFSFQQTRQSMSYTLSSFFSDVGGYMGLLLGASIISLVEFFDYVILGVLHAKNKTKKENNTAAMGSEVML